MHLNRDISKTEIADRYLSSCSDTIMQIERQLLPDMSDKIVVTPQTKVLANVFIDFLAEQFEREKPSRRTIRSWVGRSIGFHTGEPFWTRCMARRDQLWA